MGIKGGRHVRLTSSPSVNRSMCLQGLLQVWLYFFNFLKKIVFVLKFIRISQVHSVGKNSFSFNLKYVGNAVNYYSSEEYYLFRKFLE
jgi:hypothetical protein